VSRRRTGIIARFVQSGFVPVLHTAVVEIVELESVPGFIVFDLPGVTFSAGGTRLAADVTRAEVALLARAMTYKFAALGEQVGGAKAGVAAGPADRAARAGLMARYCAEIRPLAEAGRFLTGPDMGTFEEDFSPLRERQAAPAAVSAVVDGVPFEDVVTGYGVVAAAETALRLGARRRPGGPVSRDRGVRQGGRRGGQGGRAAGRPGCRRVHRRRLRRGPIGARRRAAAGAAPPSWR
jgi:glutamate dehydrogenase (NAD(P)+)